MTIVTVTANPALDVTYTVADLALDTTQRVEQVHHQAGGKGLNVARALTLMGVSALALAIVGGPTGALIREDLEVAGIDAELVEAEGDSRRTVTARAPGSRSLELLEPGMEITAATWDALASALAARIEPGDVVAISGSLPRGVPASAYRTLVDVAHNKTCRVVLDTSGPALELALAGGVEVAKPNEAELATFWGSVPTSNEEILAACEQVRSAGAAAVVASRGPLGVLAVSGDGTVAFEHPAREGNAVGAGDVLVAGIAAGLEAGGAFEDAVRQGVEWAFASLAWPYAGWVDEAGVVAGRSAVSVRSGRTGPGGWPREATAGDSDDSSGGRAP